MRVRPHPLASWLGPALSGLLIVLSFEPFAWWWCGWIALAPAWIALRTSAEVRRSPLRYGYLVGLMFIIGCFWWTGAVTLVGLFVMALVLSFYSALWFMFVARLLRLPAGGSFLPWLGLGIRAGLAAAFWITLEWLRGWFMSGFNWNELGVSQVPSLHLRQLAALGGVPLLTGLLVFVGILIGEAVLEVAQRRWRQAVGAFVAAALIIAAGWGYGVWHLHRRNGEVPRASISYAAIQPNIAELPYGKATTAQLTPLEVEAMNIQQDLSARAVASQPDLLIWPEAVTVQQFSGNSLLQQVVNHLQGIYQGEILVGAVELDHGKLFNTAYLVSPGRPPQAYRKVYLIVLGEYLPMTDLFPWLRQWWGRGAAFSAGTVPGHLLLPHEGLSLAPLICFEDTQPQIVRAAAARQPDFFVTLVNAGWFTEPLTAWCLTQHLENARLRCVEHDRPMIRCADTGITCEIDAEGRVVARLPAFPAIRGILAQRLFLYPDPPTLYDRWGDWIGLLSRAITLGVCLAYLLLPFRFKTPK